MVKKSPKAAPRSAPVPRSARGRQLSGFDQFFEITRRGSTIPREVRGGIVTFFTMAYIIALNPLIIGTQPDSLGNLIGGLAYKDAAGKVIGSNVDATIAMIAAGTALIAGLMTIAMGLVGRFPIGIAAGLGINVLLATTLAPKMTWPQVMGLVVLEGVIIAVLVLTGFRTAVFKAVPKSLRYAIAVGIGLFIALVGLVDGGIVRRPSAPTAPPVELGIDGHLLGWPTLVFVVGFLLMAVLWVWKVRGAILISIVSATVLAVVLQLIFKVGSRAGGQATGWSLNVPATSQLVALPNLGSLFKVSLFGSFGEAGTPLPGGQGVHLSVLALIMAVFTLMLADFFDSMGTVVAVGAEGHLLDAKGNPPHVTGIMFIDSLAAVVGGLGSVSSNTSYIESTSGVAEGARTGFASVVTGVLFLLAVFLSPLVKAIPSEAAAPALVFVGFLMLTQVVRIDWHDPEEGIPAFLTIALMPFAYNITVGIGAGFVSYVVLKLVRGKFRQVHPLMYVVAAAFLIYFGQGLWQLVIK